MLTPELRVTRHREAAERLQEMYEEEGYRIGPTRWYHKIVLAFVPAQSYKDANGTGWEYQILLWRIHLVTFFTWRKAR